MEEQKKEERVEVHKALPPAEPQLVYAERTMMPFCCGVEVLGAFNGGYMAANRVPIHRALSVPHGMYGWNRAGSQVNPPPEFPGIVLATTVDAQKTANKKLKEMGFLPLLKFHNDCHGNTVTLWIKTRKDKNASLLTGAVKALWRLWKG